MEWAREHHVAHLSPPREHAGLHAAEFFGPLARLEKYAFAGVSQVTCR